jgi:hypothetical protein
MRQFETFINSRRLVGWLPDVPFLHDYIDSIELTGISLYLLRPINLLFVLGLNAVVYFNAISLRLERPKLKRAGVQYFPGFCMTSLTAEDYSHDAEISIYIVIPPLTKIIRSGITFVSRNLRQPKRDFP